MDWSTRFWQMEKFCTFNRAISLTVLSRQERAASIQWAASAVTHATADNLGYFQDDDDDDCSLLH